MSGILDNKTRVLDTIVTNEGRRQLATGGINIRYVTFTDAATFYEADVVSGSADATTRVYLESCNLPQDTITFRADDLGKITSFDTNSDVTVSKGQLHQHVFDPISNLSGAIALFDTVMTGSDLMNHVDGVLSSSLDNFVNLQTIASMDGMFDDSQFALGCDNVTFNITNDRPLSGSFVINENELHDLIEDPRLNNLANFKCMPPIQRSDETVTQLGLYTTKTSNDIATHDTIIDEHQPFISQGCAKTIKFDPTSRKNNLLMQAFEVSNDTMIKLDVIDFGVRTMTKSKMVSRRTVGNNRLTLGNTSHIFFVGKLLLKHETQTHTFVHLFTLIFG